MRPAFPRSCRALPEEAPLRLRCGPGGLDGAALGLTGAEVTDEVVVHVAFRDGRVGSGVLRRGQRLWLPAGRAGTRAVIGSYLALGVRHILLGWDHLLLLLALLLLHRGPRSLLLTLTAFTAAHSLTLALAALGLLRVPAAPVEALIAISVALLAAELCRGPERTLCGRRPALVALLFGLLHGLGFAGALREAGLPPGQVPLALLCFNLGVEVGQLLFVLPLCAPATMLTRLACRWPAGLRLPAYAIGAVAMATALTRLAQLGAAS